MTVCTFYVPYLQYNFNAPCFSPHLLLCFTLYVYINNKVIGSHFGFLDINLYGILSLFWCEEPSPKVCKCIFIHLVYILIFVFSDSGYSQYTDKQCPPFRPISPYKWCLGNTTCPIRKITHTYTT